MSLKKCVHFLCGGGWGGGGGSRNPFLGLGQNAQRINRLNIRVYIRVLENRA